MEIKMGKIDTDVRLNLEAEGSMDIELGSEENPLPPLVQMLLKGIFENKPFTLKEVVDDGSDKILTLRLKPLGTPPVVLPPNQE